MTWNLYYFWKAHFKLKFPLMYNDRLLSCRLDHRKFDDMQQQYLSGKAVIDKLAGDFEMMFEFKSMCIKLPDLSYSENVDLRELAKEMINLYLPVVD